MITAIAVLALMLVLFGGMAMVYSSQVSRNKVEHEQSQAMLLAQSYMEMLNDVLTDEEFQQDFIKEFGSIQSNVPVELSASISEEYPKHQVKIIATAENEKYSGNTKTREIKVKVTVTVDDEARSILANYTYKEVTGGALLDYAVYANKINFYPNGDEDKEGDPILFNSTWYKGRGSTQTIDTKQLVDADGYKFGGIARGQFNRIFHIKKNGEINPENDDFSGFAQAVNHADLSRSIAPWDLSEPDGTIPSCQQFGDVITQSCIWDDDEEMSGSITFEAVDEDIVVYIPIDDDFELNQAEIKFYNNNNIGIDGTPKQLYFYAYSTNPNQRAEIEFDEKSTITTISDNNPNEYVDVFFICNDDIDVKFERGNEKKQLEAYFYFPKGKVNWEMSEVEKDKYKDENRIRGCLIAQEIMVMEKQNESHNGYVGIDYVPPRAIERGGSGTTSASVTLNHYEEGGKS